MRRGHNLKHTRTTPIDIIVIADGDTLYVTAPDTRAARILAETGLHRDPGTADFHWSTPSEDDRHAIAGDVVDALTYAGYTGHLAAALRPTGVDATPLSPYADAAHDHLTTARATGYTDAATALMLADTADAAALAAHVLAKIRELATTTLRWLAQHPDAEPQLADTYAAVHALVHTTGKATLAAQALHATLAEAPSRAPGRPEVPPRRPQPPTAVADTRSPATPPPSPPSPGPAHSR